MSAFRGRSFEQTGSERRKARRAKYGITVVSSAAPGTGYPADRHPTRKRGRPNPRWAGMTAGLRYRGNAYALVDPPTPKKQKERRPTAFERFADFGGPARLLTHPSEP